MSILPEEDTRNVPAKYKTWSTDLINEDLSHTRTGLINIFMNLEHDFNLASGIRNSAFLNVHSVYVVGKRTFDRRGSVGSHHYLSWYRRPDLQPVVEKLKAFGYTIVGADPDDARQWKLKTLRNSLFCKSCNTHVQSISRYDMQSCPCGNISVDGGLDYRRLLFRDANMFEDTSINI